jgi:hypothetical protein
MSRWAFLSLICSLSSTRAPSPDAVEEVPGMGEVHEKS